MMRSVPYDRRESVRPGRVQALMDLGFPIRDARFLAHVLVFSGVFIERQYRTFAGVAHGQRTHDFLTKLLDGGFATAITPGALHRGRLYHVQYRPLYEASNAESDASNSSISVARTCSSPRSLDNVMGPRRTRMRETT